MKGLRIAVVLMGMLPGASIAQRAPAVVSGPFEFHSDLWMNLHHFLYHWTNHVIATERSRQPPIAVTEIASARLSPGELEVWNRAVDQYREFATEDLLTGPKVREITDLLTSGRPAAPDWGKLRPAFTSALRNAAVVYRDHWWLTHDLMNRRWLREVEPMLRFAQDTFVKVLPRLYGGPWPVVPHTVDVSTYSNWSGGYTTNQPDHTVIGSNHPNMKGMAGVELVFHEVSHAASLESGLIAATAAAFREAGRSEPSNFWHALLFYTTGELTAQAVRRYRQDSVYTMLSAALGMFDRPDWRGYRTAFDAHWRPAIAGKETPANALRNVVRALPAQQNQSGTTRMALRFSAQNDSFTIAAREYQQLWDAEGRRIIEAMERRSGLRFQDSVVNVIVFEGVSMSGYRERPMRMRASYPADTRKATLIHELGHRLQSNLFRLGEEDHGALFLWIYEVWVDLYGKSFADEQVAVEKRRRGPYPKAWDDALQLTAEQRAARWQTIVKERSSR